MGEIPHSEIETGRGSQKGGYPSQKLWHFSFSNSKFQINNAYLSDPIYLGFTRRSG